MPREIIFGGTDPTSGEGKGHYLFPESPPANELAALTKYSSTAGEVGRFVSKERDPITGDRKDFRLVNGQWYRSTRNPLTPEQQATANPARIELSEGMLAILPEAAPAENVADYLSRTGTIAKEYTERNLETTTYTPPPPQRDVFAQLPPSNLPARQSADPNAPGWTPTPEFLANLERERNVSLSQSQPASVSRESGVLGATYSQIPQVGGQISPIGANSSPGAVSGQPGASPLNIQRNLQPGDKGEDVKQLQNWLIQQGYPIPAGATGFFGDQTKNALTRWQSDKDVPVAGFPGYFGPRTKEAITKSQTINQPTTPSGGGQATISPNLQQEYDNFVSQVPDAYKGIADQLFGAISKTFEKGQTINPNVELTPQKLSEFVQQASREIDPYYSTQLKLAKDTFLKSVGFSTEEIIQDEKLVEQRYARELRQQGEQFAEQGFAESGIRKRAETELAQSYQSAIDQPRRQLTFGAGEAAGRFAQQYGEQGLRNLPSLNIGPTPQVLPGQAGFTRSGASRTVYELSPATYESLVGTQQYEQEATKRRRISELEGAERARIGLQQTRSLTF